ncbi:hypothetical protein L596_025418 [Steinernema carpocapsae]|uniref:Uncharacterized protein n=1 Tax=Steinernema carpocapsae TaxID=34508 RepID=A0A4U5M7Q1_STECR|nr:hypothetical protein L596_025418 [Steinernema carpocapsae]
MATRWYQRWRFGSVPFKQAKFLNFERFLLCCHRSSRAGCENRTVSKKMASPLNNYDLFEHLRTFTRFASKLEPEPNRTN